jgi:pimeloyl-ACP methyl ester carboxylesterase
MAIEDGPDVRVLSTSAGQVRVRDTGGSGPPILLVHSLLLDPDLYATLTPLLVAQGYRCVIPELPLGGHGMPLHADADLSPPGLAALLVEVLDLLSLERVHVVGVDTGGALAQLLMADHRDRVGAVVLTACDAYDQFPPTTVLGYAFRPLFWPGLLAAASVATRLRLFRRLLTLRPITHRGVDDDVLRRWTAPARDPLVRRDVRKAWLGMEPTHTLRAADVNRTFPRPVLVAWGDDDRLFRRSLADQLLADLPHARLVTLPDCAAFAALDQPVLLAGLIHAHLEASQQALLHSAPSGSARG